MSARAIEAFLTRTGAIERRTVALQIGAEAMALRAAIPVLVRLWPLDRVLRALSFAGGPQPRPAELLATVERVTDFVTRRVRLTRTACLERALLRYALLRRRGFEPRFLIGVRPGGADGFEAHAWLCLDGAPIMERERLGCRPTFEWPQPR